MDYCEHCGERRRVVHRVKIDGKELWVCGGCIDNIDGWGLGDPPGSREKVARLRREGVIP